MASRFENSILIGTHVINLQTVAHFMRLDHHASGKATRVEFIGGTQLEFFNADGDRLWAWVCAGASKLEDAAASRNSAE